MSLEDFYIESKWGSEAEKETRNRIKLSVYAYAYEMQSDSLISDGDFDKMCLDINPQLATGNEEIDKFFKEEFNPSTGQWIHKHPNLNRIAEIYKNFYEKK